MQTRSCLQVASIETMAVLVHQTTSPKFFVVAENWVGQNFGF